jgi:hypothetical protein
MTLTQDPVEALGVEVRRCLQSLRERPARAADTVIVESLARLVDLFEGIHLSHNQLQKELAAARWDVKRLRAVAAEALLAAKPILRTDRYEQLRAEAYRETQEKL